MNTLLRNLILLLSLLAAFQAFGQQYELTSTLTDNDGPVTTIIRHPDNKLLINGDTSGKLYFRDAGSGQLFRKIKAHGSAVNTLCFNSNGQLLISTTRDGEVKVFDFKKDAIVQSIYSPEYNNIHFALFSIADGFIYFSSGKKLFKTRSDLTQKVDLVLEEQDTLYDAVITNDRSSLIYSAGNRLKVLNTRSDVIRQEFSTGNFAIRKMQVLGDTVVVTWSDDGTISYWNYQLGQIGMTPFLWMKAGVPSVMSFSRDGRLMVSGNIGNWARIWEPESRLIKQELFGHKGTVTSFCFGQADQVLFTGSTDGTVRVWRSGKYTVPTVPVMPATASNDSPPVIQDSVPPKTEPIPATDLRDSSASVEPVVQLTEGNIPIEIGGRKVNQAGTIEVNSSRITIFVFDNSYIDGDTMSLYFNEKWILDHYGVTKSKKSITLEFKENTNNYLVLFANNLGKTPPNTAAIQFNDGKTDRFFKLSSDLTTCSALNFLYKKP